MKYFGVIFLGIIAILAGVFWYFSQWWQRRVVLTTNVLPIASMAPQKKGLAAVVSSYRPLARGEMEKELTGGGGYEGVVRYSKENGKVSFTVLVQGGGEERVEVEIYNKKVEKMKKVMERVKGGWVFDGVTGESEMPVSLTVWSKGEVVLRGNIE